MGEVPAVNRVIPDDPQTPARFARESRYPLLNLPDLRQLPNNYKKGAANGTPALGGAHTGGQP
jgi:hypothetical protein